MSTITVATEVMHDVRVVRLPIARRHRRLPLPVLGLLGWITAAAGVYSSGLLSHGLFRGVSPAWLAAGRIGFIVVIGAAFARAARGVSPEAIGATGLCWLVLSIAADLVAATRSLDAACRLLGDPSVAPRSLRDLTILVWFASPTLFARRADPGEGHSRRISR